MSPLHLLLASSTAGLLVALTASCSTCTCPEPEELISETDTIKSSETFSSPESSGMSDAPHLVGQAVTVDTEERTVTINVTRENGAPWGVTFDFID